MAVETHIHDLLVGTGAISAIVGTRVYMGQLPPQVQYPCVLFFQVSGYEHKTLEETDGWNESRFQFDCYADTYTVAKQLAAAVHNAVKNYEGSINSTTIKSFTQLFKTDYKEPAPRMFRTQMDYEIWHTEDV